jgi:hypothetical protein
MERTVKLGADLIREAMEITGAATEREAIERALESYLAQQREKHSRKNMFDLVGKVRLRDDYDYKALRAGDEAERTHADLPDLIDKVGGS